MTPQMDSAPFEQGTYVAYMLRLWQAGNRDGQPVWRASLENPHTGERLVFGDTKALFAFLADLTSFRAEIGVAPEVSD
jgi:hypothetical protein